MQRWGWGLGLVEVQKLDEQKGAMLACRTT